MGKRMNWYKVYDKNDNSTTAYTGASRKEYAIEDCKDWFDANAVLVAKRISFAEAVGLTTPESKGDNKE